MKWLAMAVVLVAAVWLLAGRAPEPSENLGASDMASEPTKGPEPILDPVPASQAGGDESDETSTTAPSTDADDSLEPDTDGVINIGEPMDPDDPSTWPQPENTEVINIGEPMDPDDPSTWPQPENTEVINIGEPMNPDDPSTWPQPENTEVINIGEPMDPDDPSTWPQPENTEVINIGEPMDPDNPSTWD